MDASEASEAAASAVSTAAAAASSTSGSMSYPAKLQADKVKSMAQVKEALAAGDWQVVDARSLGRFAGKDPEPRASLPSGHMPGVHLHCFGRESLLLFVMLVHPQGLSLHCRGDCLGIAMASAAFSVSQRHLDL